MLKQGCWLPLVGESSQIIAFGVQCRHMKQNVPLYLEKDFREEV